MRLKSQQSEQLKRTGIIKLGLDMRVIDINKIKTVEHCKLVMALLIGYICQAKSEKDMFKFSVSEQVLKDFPELKELL